MDEQPKESVLKVVAAYVLAGALMFATLTASIGFTVWIGATVLRWMGIL